GLVEKLDAFPVHDRVVPHLTIKRWFELDEDGLQSVCDALDNIAATRKQSSYRLHGYNHFGDGVIYVDVTPSQETLDTVSAVMEAMRGIDGMTFDEYDEIQGDLHATVAMRALKPFDFQETWDYLQTLPPIDMNLQFDNIAILKKVDGKWVPEKVWELAA
ncbi:MAG: 2'-5' RNA ligase family protein, partial [Okeania sp. SIO3H1]|nr:2'-5' RNA ligase family protein [Okeania sp. SIO3H1]